MRRSTARTEGPSAPLEIGYYRTDFEKMVVVRGFERRGWRRAPSEEDWDIYWASVHSIRQIFNPENGRRLQEHQMVNHYPNHYELTRKDLMARNIKRYRKEREKEKVLQEQQAIASVEPQPPPMYEEHELPADWAPTTFALPSDYALFVEEFRRNPNVTWIAKPTGKAQGKGIFLVSKLNQLKKWSGGQKGPFSQTSPFSEPYIISRYINNPLLVGGKKFDMRLYVLVTSYRPLKAYMYRGGFCRFCVEQYSSDVAEIDNVFVHLTNVAVQKHAEDYNDTTGGKWAIEDLLLFIESTRGLAMKDKLMLDMEAVIVHSLKAVQGVMINDRHCFEMYGFDILLDSNLRPWLLEVNASPSLSTTTAEDRLLKLRLIHDVLGIVIANRNVDAQGASNAAVESALGGFYCLLDEGRQQQQRQREEEMRKRSSGDRRRNPGRGLGGSMGWR